MYFFFDIEIKTLKKYNFLKKKNGLKENQKQEPDREGIRGCLDKN